MKLMLHMLKLNSFPSGRLLFDIFWIIPHRLKSTDIKSDVLKVFNFEFSVLLHFMNGWGKAETFSSNT